MLLKPGKGIRIIKRIKNDDQKVHIIINDIEFLKR